MYIWIAIIAYLLFALNGIADKFLLTRAVKHPIAYAFYIGITSPLVLFLAPFGLKLLRGPDYFVALVAGMCFVVALYFLYKAIQATSISRILPIEGGFVPIFTLVLAYFILGERLTSVQFASFAFLVGGAVLIAFRKEGTGWRPAALGNGIIAAFLFALSFTLTKYIYDQSNFVSGLVWTRLGFFVTSLAFLIPRQNRQYIKNAPKETSTANKFLYYGTRLAGSLGGFLQNYAISIGSVIIVNALQGTQYAFLLLLTILLSIYYPKILNEKISRGILAQKTVAIILITVGLILLI